MSDEKPGSAEQVALQLAHQIAAEEMGIAAPTTLRSNEPRSYWLELYRMTLRATQGRPN